MCTAEAFGIACYEGRVDHNEWVGVHVGVVFDEGQAEAWLRGEEVPLMIIDAYARNGR